MYFVWLLTLLLSMSLSYFPTDFEVEPTEFEEGSFGETFQQNESLVVSDEVAEDKVGDSLVNIEARLAVLTEVLDVINLSYEEAADWCESCAIDSRNVYVYDQNIESVEIAHESFASFYFQREQTEISDLTIIEALKEFGWVSGLNYEPPLSVGDAGGPSGSVSVLVKSDVSLEAMQFLKVSERIKCEAGEQWGVGDGCSAKEIKISVPDIVDLRPYY